ncbi:hypothetical protein DM48_160 [Burkholderia gladioli]|uniref:eCIS core domain-containing protein n=1 Tax=Burkholderia gladioli TaxID=28095 RepID=A0AAW3F071_BURGA|nr:DUF4157 domain-containing protein [Burkholderia gladioli]KGC13285.1 hypothetical protein DM48_160 [Burkholderia gladioli]
MPGSRKTSLIAPAMAPKRVEARESASAPGLAPQAEHLVAMGEFHYAAAAGSPLQRRATNAAAGPDSAGSSTAAGPANRNAPANRTGLPDRLKAGIESLSGYSLDKVKVSYNSSRPAQLMAHAYARGHEIHIAPGKQAHLPHEAWHLVQQAQGRVATTTQAAGLPVNDDDALEREADVMGRKARAYRPIARPARRPRSRRSPPPRAPLPPALPNWASSMTRNASACSRNWRGRASETSSRRLARRAGDASSRSRPSSTTATRKRTSRACSGATPTPARP